MLTTRKLLCIVLCSESKYLLIRFRILLITINLLSLAISNSDLENILALNISFSLIVLNRDVPNLEHIMGHNIGQDTISNQIGYIITQLLLNPLNKRISRNRLFQRFLILKNPNNNIATLGI